MKLEVHRGNCVGAGQCVLNAPEVFDQDDSATVVLLTDEPAPELWEDVRSAVSQCPGQVITIQTGEA